MKNIKNQETHPADCTCTVCDFFRKMTGDIENDPIFIHENYAHIFKVIVIMRAGKEYDKTTSEIRDTKDKTFALKFLPDLFDEKMDEQYMILLDEMLSKTSVDFKYVKQILNQ